MTEKPERLLFPDEVRRQLAAFERSPLQIVAEFLESFDSEGKQQFEVPPHVLEALASRFRMVVGPAHEGRSLDQAFGGRIKRQRDALRRSDENSEVAFYIADEIKAAKKLDRSSRSGTPFELAVERTADLLDLGEEDVRRRYKETK